MTTDGDIETAMSALLTPAPATLAPNVLAEVGLADLYARFDSPIGPLVVAWNGLGVSAVEAAADDATFEANHVARTGRPTHRAERLPDGLGRPSRAGWTATAASGSTWTCAATPTSSATSGTRRSRSRGARSGPTAGSPRRSADRRRSARSAPPWGTTRCRSSCPAIASSGPTAASASTRWAGRRTSGRSWPPRAWTRMRWSPPPGPASATSARTRPTSCACRRATHAKRITPAHRVPFRSLASAAAAGYRACRECRPASGALAA